VQATVPAKVPAILDDCEQAEAAPISLALIETVEKLPALPSAVTGLARMLNDEDATQDQIEALIRPNPSLTTNLLRVANSVLYRARVEIKTVRQALQRLGVRKVYDLALSAAFVRLLPRTSVTGYGIDAGMLWKHSVAVAVVAEKLAARGGAEMADLAYTAGLIHDLGEMVIGLHLMKVPAFAKHVGEGFETLQEERSVLGLDHCKLAQLAAEKWSLPTELALVARYHHEPQSAPAGAARSLSWIVSVADRAALEVGYGAPLDAEHSGEGMEGQLELARKIAAEQKEAIEDVCTALS